MAVGWDLPTEARLRGDDHFVAHLPLPAAFVDADSIVAAVSPAAYDLLGYAPGSLEGTTGIDLIHPDDLDRATAALERILSAPFGSESIGLRLRLGDGSYHPGLVRVTNLAEEPSLLGLLAFFELLEGDVVPRSGWFEALISRAPHYALVLDADGRLLHAGGSRMEQDGRRYVGRKLITLLPERNKAEVGEWLARVLTEPGSHRPGQLTWRDSQGRRRLVEATATNLLHDPEVGGVLVIGTDVTDEVESRITVQAAGELVARSPLIVITVDRDARVLTWNPAAERVLGWSSEEAVGRMLPELRLFTPASAGLRADWAVHFRPGDHTEIHTTVLNRQGELVPVYVAASATLDPLSGQGRFHLLGLDLRELEEAKAGAALVEARWAAIHAEAREAVAIIGMDGRASYAGPGIERLLGYPPASLIGRELIELVHPDHGGVDALLTAALAGNAETTTELTIRHADGSWRVLSCTIANRVDDPAINGFLVHGVDVTDRVAVEDDNRRLAEAIDTAGAVVIVTDMDARVLSWNKAAERLLRITAVDAVGHVRPIERIDEALRNRIRAAADRVRAGETLVFDTGLVSTGDRTVELTFVGAPVRGPAGDVVGSSWVGFDVTEARAASREREQRAAQQAVVAALGQRALAGASVEDLLVEAAHLVAATLEVDHCAVFVPGADEGTVRIAAASGAASAVAGVEIPADFVPWIEEAHGAARPMTLEGVEVLSCWDGSLGPAPVGGAAAPMAGRHGRLGVIAAMHGSARVYDDTDLDFLNAVAAALGSAVERQRIDEEMRHRAMHDQLTGLPNRALLLDRLSQALGRADRHGEHLALLFLDLDRFKRVNDTLGHVAGDEALVIAATRLADAVRPGDTVARVGGDEFLVLCEDVGDAAQARRLADRLGASLAQPAVLRDKEVVLTASIGIALADGRAHGESLVTDADLAMYRAKQRGRARSEVFDEAMRDEVSARLEIEEALRRTVDGPGISVVFQPLVDLRDGRAVGFEALARWDHERFHTLSPPEFLAVADEIGRLEDVESSIIEQAVSSLAQLRAVGGPELTMSINASARQLVGGRLVEQISAASAAHGLPDGSVVVELTERDVVDDGDAREALTELRAKGIAVSIDDFGVGYSSLERVTRLPVDEIKIDRAFVAGLGRDKAAAAVLRATVTLAEALGTRLVAEGVERADQRDALLELGCCYAQGWLFARPMSLDALTAWLAEHSSSLPGA